MSRAIGRRSGGATTAQTRAYAARSDLLAPQLRAEIATVPAHPHGRPALVVLMGLPGVGKSHLARLLCGRLGAAHVASDELRSRLFVAPSYADEENRVIFAAARALVDGLLAEGHRVVVDATNLLARSRGGTADAARRRGAPVVYVLVSAPGRNTLRMPRGAAEIFSPLRITPVWRSFTEPALVNPGALGQQRVEAVPSSVNEEVPPPEMMMEGLPEGFPLGLVPRHSR